MTTYSIGVVDLLAEILWTVPHLTGAACQGHWDVFDSNAADDVHEAIRLCRCCPAMLACRTWANRQTGLAGVFGGQIMGTMTKHADERIER